MKKYLSYILILIAFVGIFGFGLTDKARAQVFVPSPDDNGTCTLHGLTYNSCTGPNSKGGVPQPPASSTAPNGPTGNCIVNDTRGQCAAQADGVATSGDGSFILTDPTGICTVYGSNTQTITTNNGCYGQNNRNTWVQSAAGTPQAGGPCTGGGGTTPTGCDPTVPVPGSTCKVTESVLNTGSLTSLNPSANFQNSCSGKGNYTASSTFGSTLGSTLGSTCTISNYSPTSCGEVNWGSPQYYDPGQTPGTATPLSLVYTLLAPLPNVGATFDPSAPNALGTYINLMIKIFIGICAVLAVIMVLWGGIEYMTSELISSKEAGKEKIRDALFGLILALGAWALLYTINPNILNSQPNIPTAAADYGYNPTLEPEIGGSSSKTLTINGISENSCDTSQLTTVSLFGSNVTVNKAIASNVAAVNAAWVAQGGSNFYPVNSVGGYNCRNIANSSSVSDHAFGMAIDINPSTNPYGPALKTDMPQSFINDFTSNGFGWGGNWSTKKDAMHFSAMSNEGGSF